jgi:PAS domain S-box-containing protein
LVDYSAKTLLAPAPLNALAPTASERDELLTLAEQCAGIGVWDIDLTTGMARGTEQFFRIMGLDPRPGPVSMDTIRAVRHPEDQGKVVDGFNNALLQGLDSYEVEYRIIHPNGDTRWIFGRGRVVRNASGKPVRYSGADIDITERKKAEAALAEANRELGDRVRERTAQLEAEALRRAEAETLLHQAQKMEAVGQLTGGVAHDFNNLLTIIIGNLETLQRRLHGGPVDGADLKRLSDYALVGAKRAASLTQQLLAFARRQPLNPRTLDINQLVTDMSNLLARTLGEAITVETILAPGLWPAFVDPNQLEVAILNLAVNARDAMPNGGRLTITTANLQCPGAGTPSNLTEGSHVLIAVSDTGSGMDASVISRAFEPFFTTKDIGQGTGLGLSQVYGFVNQSGGHVTIDSAVGVGTSVTLYLPHVVGKHVDSHGSPPAERSQRARANSETILVVEDNDFVREYSTDILRELGYRVLEAPDAVTALALIETSPDIRVLFTDVGLPGAMNGRGLAEAAMGRRPDLKVLFTSGYAKDSVVKEGRLEPGVQLLTKPFTFDVLADRMRELFDEGSAQ